MTDAAETTEVPLSVPLFAILRVLSWLTVLAIVIGAAVVTFPRLVGMLPITIVSESMGESMPVGSIAFAKETTPEAVAAGDIVSYYPISGDPTLIVHRLVSATDLDGDGLVDELLTKGDVNGAADAPIMAVQLAHRVEATYPMLGWFLDWLIPTGGIVALVGILAILLLPRPGGDKASPYETWKPAERETVSTR